MKKLIIILTIIVPLFIISCKKNLEIPQYKLDVISENVYVGTKFILVSVNYAYPGGINYAEGYISRYSDMSDYSITQAETNDSVFVIRFDNLLANTDYYKYEYSNGVDKNNQMSSALRLMIMERQP